MEALAVGLCGTDAEIVAAEYGQAPPGRKHLVLGHENLGRVLEAPHDSGLAEGDLVVGIVRRPDPEPCAACAAGEWDMCLNGKYTEHGIKGLDGFARERWRAHPQDMVKLAPGLVDVGVLLEPTTVVAKAWEQIGRIGQRAFFCPRTAVVTGAGPVGLLAALLGVQQGLDVHVFDLVTDGPKTGSGPRPWRDLPQRIAAGFRGQRQRPGRVHRSDPVVLDVLTYHAQDAITCLTGVSGTGKQSRVDVRALNREAVLTNGVVFGSVNANRRHYDAAAKALSEADESWLRRLITRRLPLAEFAGAFEHRPDDVKVVLDIGARGAAGKQQ